MSNTTDLTNNEVVNDTTAFNRTKFIEQYNANNTDSKILDQDVTEDDIKEIETRMDALKEARASMSYEIADTDNALRIATFLRDWNANDFFWVKDMWRGVLKFDEFITSEIEKITTTAQPLVFDFGALTYVYNAMMQPTGRGIDAARFMEEISDTYDSVLDIVGQYIEDFQEENKLFQRLGNCLQARYQGLMMVLAEDLTDDTTEDTDAVEELPDNVVKL